MLTNAKLTRPKQFHPRLELTRFANRDTAYREQVFFAQQQSTKQHCKKQYHTGLIYGILLVLDC